MITLHLLYDDEADALAAFSAVTGLAVASLADVPSKVEVGGRLCDIDVIGPVSAAFGEVDDAGVSITGWRVNIWAPDDAVVPALLAPHRVDPARPARVFE